MATANRNLTTANDSTAATAATITICNVGQTVWSGCSHALARRAAVSNTRVTTLA